MFFVPAKDCGKVKARFKVRVLPEVETLDAAPLSVHRVFVWRPLRGGRPEAGGTPPSVSSHKVFRARLKLPTQPFTVETAVLKLADTLVRSAAPALSTSTRATIDE